MVRQQRVALAEGQAGDLQRPGRPPDRRAEGQPEEAGQDHHQEGGEGRLFRQAHHPAAQRSEPCRRRRGFLHQRPEG
ncbi:hypothetical protein D9M71_612840 [compost metagenome]